jgi:transcription elongation factor Elf1
MKKTEHVADATCGNCGMAATFTIVRADEPIDVYCKFTDKFYAGDMTVDA